MERLQKVLAAKGVCSRRKAEELILQGRISVNGEVASELGTKISETDQISVDGKPLVVNENLVYVMLNKPPGVITSASDPRGRRTVLDFGTPKNIRLFPVGRLDYDSSGLIILTNDGDFAYKMTHPKHEVSKTYEAVIRNIPGEEEIKKLQEGVFVEGKKTSPATVNIIQAEPDVIIHITIHEGRNRQIRKMLENVGHPVIKLKRISVGNLSLGNLPPGKWRYLRTEELNNIYN